MPVAQHSNDRNDVTESAYVSGVVSVSDTEIEAKAGASRLSERQTIIFYNKGPSIAYFGPTGVSTSNGIPLVKGRIIKVMLGDMGVFLISDSNGADVVVQEVA